MTLSAKSLQSKTEPRSGTGFEAAFRQHWPKVYGLLYRLLGDPDEAEDLALETFWRLHRRPPPQNDPDSLGGWLYRVATNLGLNALRARQRRQRYETEAGQLALEDEAPRDPASVVEQRQAQAQVRATLTKMKPRSAKLLVLRHTGFSYAEIAAALEIAPGSVGTLLARAEREFEEKYADEG